MYSRDFKLLVVRHHKEGNSQDDTAVLFKVGTTSIERWSKEFDATGDICAIFNTENRRARKIDPEKLKTMVEENPSLFPKDIALIFNCSDDGIRYAMKKAKITRKKK